MTIRAFACAFVLSLAVAARLSAATPAPSPLGYWLNPTGQVTFLIRAARDGTLSISVAAVSADVQERAQDVVGKDSVLGIQWDPVSLTGKNGRILEYRDGKAVRRGDCRISLIDGGARLKVDFRSGILGHTAYWTRTAPPGP